MSDPYEDDEDGPDPICARCGQEFGFHQSGNSLCPLPEGGFDQNSSFELPEE